MRVASAGWAEDAGVGEGGDILSEEGLGGSPDQPWGEPGGCWG